MSIVVHWARHLFRFQFSASIGSLGRTWLCMSGSPKKLMNTLLIRVVQALRQAGRPSSSSPHRRPTRFPTSSGWIAPQLGATSRLQPSASPFLRCAARSGRLSASRKVKARRSQAARRHARLVAEESTYVRGRVRPHLLLLDLKQNRCRLSGFLES